MTDIPTTPLEEGDPVALAVDANHPTALDGQPGDVVVLVVPPGKGLLVEAWLKRQMFETPEQKLARLYADNLTEVAA